MPRRRKRIFALVASSFATLSTSQALSVTTTPPTA
jgi:hypothetical protein